MNLASFRYLLTHPLYPPPFIREGELVIKERLRLSLTLHNMEMYSLHEGEELGFEGAPPLQTTLDKRLYLGAENNSGYVSGEF